MSETLIFTLYPNSGFFLPLFAVALVNLSLGGFVLKTAPRSDTARSFFWFCLCVAFWVGSYAVGNLDLNPGLTVLAAYGVILGALPIPFIFLLLCSCFPEGNIPFKPYQLFLLILPSLVLLLSFPTGQLVTAAITPDHGLLIKLGSFHQLYMMHITLYFLAGTTLLVYRYSLAKTSEKVRDWYFFAGLLLAAGVGYGFSAFAVILGWYRLIMLGPLGTIFLIVFTTYAILKYRLMDVTLVIKKTTTYSLVTTGITFTYVIVVMGFEYLYRSWLGYYSFWAAVPAALVIAITFVPLRDRLQSVTDRFFFRRVTEYQKIIREITRTMSSVTDLHTLFRLIDRTIVRVMCIKNASVLLLEEKEGCFLVEKINGLPVAISGQKLALEDPLVSYLEEKKDAVVLEELRSQLAGETITPGLKEKLERVQAKMIGFEAAVTIPSFLKGKLVGILNLGEKLSGEMYSPDDLELLLTMASEAAIAIENAKLYRDVTETRDYLDSLVRGSSDAIITLDLNGEILSWNEGARAIFGYEPEELIGQRPPFLQPEELSGMIARVLRGEELKAVEIKRRVKGGRETPLLLTMSPIRDRTVGIIGVSTIIKDIAELRKADVMKQQFLSVISHELRTPLTPIKGYISLFLMGTFGQLDEKQKEALKVVFHQSEHLQDLIDSMIDISRIEAGNQLQLEKEPVFIDQLVEESVRAVAYSFQEKGVKLAIEKPEKRYCLLADRKKLLRVMANLLGNALKFTPRDGSVTIALTSTEEAVQVTVRDTGIGIDPLYLDKVFERFFQIDSSYTRESGGIGMGLTIASEIVQAHHGRVWIESDGLGSGSRANFTLPVNG
ncbi:MAG: ATP-binding protein [Candidatus Margulisbacteria bacterium]|jgi:PAS domain S-box-containing protein|nr:ATP-binding protein [Candidatus Margulisiibacteriota bacterium]